MKPVYTDFTAPAFKCSSSVNKPVHNITVETLFKTFVRSDGALQVRWTMIKSYLHQTVCKLQCSHITISRDCRRSGTCSFTLQHVSHLEPVQLIHQIIQAFLLTVTNRNSNVSLNKYPLVRFSGGSSSVEKPLLHN